MTADQTHPTVPVRRIAFVLQSGADLLDLAGPAGVFHCAGRHFVWINASDVVTYQLDYLSPSGGLIKTRQGLVVETSILEEAVPADYDTVLVIGGVLDERDCPPELLDWLKSCIGAVRRIGSVCVGAYVLARAGLLDGKRATTHWERCADLAARFPKIRLEPDAIYTEDDGIWTGAGVSAGIDLALAMIEEDHGHELALLVARRQVVFLKRPGGQSQFSSQLECQQGDHRLAPLLQWIVENPKADLRAEALAERSNMSLRSFYRCFAAATGVSPADWVENARLEVSRRLLEQADYRLDRIARESGFGTYERMRRTFARRLGVSPADYRARFARPAPRIANAMDISRHSDIYGPAAAPPIQ